jgi:hypothetical protein
MTPSEIKLATFRLVAQCLKQLRHGVPHSLAVLSKTTESAGFCNGENEICSRLEFYTTQNGSFLTTFCDTLSVALSRVKRPLGQIGCPETLARTYHFISRSWFRASSMIILNKNQTDAH